MGEKEELFEQMYEAALKQGGLVAYQASYPKHEFLAFLVREKGVLLHGSNNQDITELEPRQANCQSKKFGNMNGVYAVEDEILPIFYAIKDRERFVGPAISGVTRTQDKTGIHKHYSFEVPSSTLKEAPWSNGTIYILPRDSFERGVDDNGNDSDEWMSSEPVVPLAKLEVGPQDFPYLNEIKPIKGSSNTG